MLEDALHILAEQHNQLEQSLGGHRSPTAMFDLDDDDEFFDCADDEGMQSLSIVLPFVRIILKGVNLFYLALKFMELS